MNNAASAIPTTATGCPIARSLIPTLGQAGWDWSRLEAEQRFAYVLEDHFGIQSVTAGVFANAAAAGPDLQRSVVVDAAGLIEYFTASNMSVVLAQPASALHVPRAVFMKRTRDVTQYREDSVRTYVLSDPFRRLREELTRMSRAAPVLGESPIAPIAISNTARVLDAAQDQNLAPSKLLRGADGIFVYFSDQERYAEIECDSDGDIGVVISDRSGKPEVWLTGPKQLHSDLASIRAFLV